MNRACRSLLAAALAALVALAGGATSAAAQRTSVRPPPKHPHRSGLWVEIAAGPGSLRMACSTCTDVIRAPGSAGSLRVGGVISDRVLLAWEAGGFTDETFGFAPTDTSIVAEMESTAIIVLWYPWRSGAFIKGGVGIAQGRFTVPTGPTQSDSVEATGVGMTFGVGWDWAFSRKYALTLNAAAFVAAIGDIVLPAGRVDDVIGTSYQLTLSFTFR